MKILIFTAHADDAEIGMGGTIARYVGQGYEVKIVCAIIPCESIDGVQNKMIKERRRGEAIQSAESLGAELEILDIDPYEFRFDRKHTKLFDQIMREYRPEKVFTCWKQDSHQDHKVLTNIVLSVTRKNDASLYMFETMLPGGISANGFNPQMFIDISEFIEMKRKSLEAYKTVACGGDYVEAIISRAHYRGRQIGVRFAEAFEVIKEIVY